MATYTGRTGIDLARLSRAMFLDQDSLSALASVLPIAHQKDKEVFIRINGNLYQITKAS